MENAVSPRFFFPTDEIKNDQTSFVGILRCYWKCGIAKVSLLNQIRNNQTSFVDILL